MIHLEGREASQAIGELEQMNMMLSEQKKNAIDEAIKALQAQADGEATDDDIATMRILFNADIECLCNQGRFNDAKEMEQIRDRLMASLQADGDIITALCSLPKIQSSDGQEYVQLADVLETVRRFKPQTDGDLISRQALLDAFGFSEKTRKWGGDHSGYNTMMLYEIQDVIESQPPVKPQPKTGHWIKYGKLYQCSECKELSCCQGKFCNECGTKMVEPQESEE